MKYLPFWLLLSGCAATRAHSPLPPGDLAWTASLGGPVVEYFGGSKPLPVTALGAAYGLDGRTTLHASLLPTQLALFRTLGLELGASHLLLEGEGSRPRVMLDLSVWGFAGPNNGAAETSYNLAPGGLRLFPEGQLLATWDFGPHRLYGGASLFTQPWPELRALPAPLLGVELRLGRLALQPEVSWLEAWRDNSPYSADFYGIGGFGALSAHLAFSFYPKEAP